MTPEEHAHRVDPQVCLVDAERILLQHYPPIDPQMGTIELVAHLLRQLREMSQLRDMKSARNSRYWQERWDEHQRVCDERNMYREALRLVKRAVRNVPVGQP